MNGSYQASIYSTVDSFYVDIINMRADTLVFDRRFEFLGGNVNISIYSSQLQVGDILKVRATATDETIFNNIVHYPDSGYALIHVLPSTVDVSNPEQLYTYSLKQNYPNPFNPSTTISYQIPEISFVTIKVYDVLGNEVATLVNKENPIGSYEVEFNASSLSSGIYFYRLQAGNFVETKKMVLLR
ncbi:MAG: hypothetical protein DRQ13_00760 [Ignavibacteriae bacterium]|nr:MAG: hypothetical protein DRQ13_00760 [Ignavibacteriota bacterium]